MPKRAHPTPDPTGCRRATASSFPRGAALVDALKEIAARHPLTPSDMDVIIAHADDWRRAILGETGSAPTGDAGAADAPSGDPTGRASS